MESPDNMCKREIVLALPDKFDIDKLGPNYFKLQLGKMNDALREKYGENAVHFNQLIPLEKARAFDPFGHAGLTPLGEIRMTLAGEIKMTPVEASAGEFL